MKQEEQDYLKEVHKKNGSKFCDERVKEFKRKQNEFKNMKKDLRKQETIIKNLTKQNEKLKLRVSKLNKKPKIKLAKKQSGLGKDIFTQDVQREEIKKYKHIINRINFNMDRERSYTKSDIKKEFLVSFKIIDLVMNYLVKQGNVRQEIVDGFVRYSKNG